jgi:DNA-binding NarL/FixJ family response regulator
MTEVFITTDKNIRLTEKLRSAIDKSEMYFVTGVFHRLKECREKLALQTPDTLPDILLLGLALRDGNGIDFCTEIREKYPDIKILMLTNDDEYAITRRVMDNGASGFIRKDALPEELISGLNVVLNGGTYLGGRIGIQENNEEQEASPEWLIALEQEILESIKKGCSSKEAIERLSLIAGSVNKCRKMLITQLLMNDPQALDADTVHKYLRILIENLLVEGYSNWEIADKLNINIDTIRVYRMDLIQKLGAKNSMMFIERRRNNIMKLTPNDMQLLRLIAAGFTSKEIANKLYLSTEAIHSRRKDLIQRSGSESTMELIIDALRQGLIKIEDIDYLTQQEY